LLASVSAPNLGITGTVIFLDSGLILGTAQVNSSGVAILPLARVSSGAHSLTASFGGTSELAPSVSPVLNDQWPASGPGFFLRIAKQEDSLAAGAAASLRVSVVPVGNSPQPIELSCANGLPEGYSCVFFPAVLAGSGDSSLHIVRETSGAHTRQRLGSWPSIAIAFVSILLMESWKNSRSRVLIVLVTIAILGSVSGCGGSSRWMAPPQTFVLTVQASMRTGTAAVVNSGQIAVQLPGSK